MADILKAAGVTDCYVCGIATDVCVGEQELENSTLIQQISNSSLDRDPFTKGLVKGLTLQNRFTIQIV